jgi:uncharacterized Rmd1/YagE family protein
MANEFFKDVETVQARATFVGQRLELRVFENTTQLTAVPLTVSAGSNGMAVLFRYGVIVFFGLQSSEIISFLENIRTLIVDRFAAPESDQVELVRNPAEAEGMEQGRIRVQDFSLQRLQIVADVMAKSLVLGHYEVRLAEHFDRIEPVAASLNQGMRAGPKGRELLQHIGDVLMIEGKMIGRVEVSEKPELIWDYPEHERLYLRLQDEYELSERHVALERKLALISKTAETFLSITQAQHTLRVEWYIVILIVIEIVITLLEKVL